MDRLNNFFTRIKINRKAARIIVIGVFFLTVADMVYASLKGINQANRETLCMLYTAVPRWLFLAYEYFIELGIVVLLGVFASTLIELYIKKVKRFFPKNQVLAFLYGAVLPVCSCGAIPLIENMKQRVPLKVIVTFIISAPLLNPYIVILSLSIFGIKYSLLRIILSFVLAVCTGIMVDITAKWSGENILGRFESCNQFCQPSDRDPFVKTLRITLNLLPFILIGGAMGFAFELFNPKDLLNGFNFTNQWISMFIMAAVGIPIYVCNGADMILLKPLLAFTDLSLGPAMVFSLTSSVVCVSSVVMMSKFLGRRLTTVLIIIVTVLSLMIGALIILYNNKVHVVS